MPPFIFIIEDEQDISHALREALEDEGYRVEAAGDGALAVERLGQMSELPDLLLLDLTMPRMDGAAFVRELKKQPRLAPRPIILLSAGSNLDARAREIGVPLFLKKPIDLSELLEMIQRVLGS